MVVLVAVVVLVVVPGVVVLVAVVVLVVVPVKPYNPLNPLARVDYQRLGIDGLKILKPALEPYAVDHDDVGGLHALNVAERRLPVVRLDAARNQHGHVGEIATDGPGRLVHRVERRQHD